MRWFFNRSLTGRVYLFALACVALVVVTEIGLIAVARSSAVHERFTEIARSIALLVTDRADDPVAAKQALEQLVQARVDSAIVASDGTVMTAAGQAVPAVDAAIVAQAEREGVVIITHDTAVADLDSTHAAALVLRFLPPKFPVLYGVFAIATLLILILAISIVFTRGLVRPLKQLSTAANRFGSGDLSTRIDMNRSDQLGDVGRAFDEMAGRITSLIEANQALMGAVSHELRTPLSRIRVALDLAAEDPAMAHELLAGVSSDLSELERLIDDTLTMTRLEAVPGKPPLHLEAVVPAELTVRLQEGWHQRHGSRPLTIDVADDLPTVMGDPVLLRRSLDNLLDNAAKYSPPEMPVSLRVRQDGDRLAFAVVDDGPGMSDDEIANAFTPFWRSDESRARGTGGVGLGLSLARQLAYAHSGDISLARAPARGLCATLHLPLAVKQSEMLANDSVHKPAPHWGHESSHPMEGRPDRGAERDLARGRERVGPRSVSS